MTHVTTQCFWSSVSLEMIDYQKQGGSG